MPASRKDIEGWLAKARAERCTHMIVKCDTFDYRGGAHDSCCYPVYVYSGQDVRAVVSKNEDRTMEVYSMRLTDKYQLAEGRAFHYD